MARPYVQCEDPPTCGQERPDLGPPSKLPRRELVAVCDEEVIPTRAEADPSAERRMELEPGAELSPQRS
jgi:hypothetical protein